MKKVLIEVEKGGLKDNILIELSFFVFNKKFKFLALDYLNFNSI